MDKKYLQDAQKELIFAEKKLPQKSPLKTVAPAIFIVMLVLLVSDDVWKKTAVNYRAYVPAHNILWICGLTASFYVLSYVPRVRDFVLFFIENRIGFGWRGRMAKTPSVQEISCMGVLFRGAMLAGLYFTALLSALDYL
ncbi:hypothetical protein [Candidatus Uabimicrobium amorphum]|uniref:Uncharacterized protein n=1 Tax=Uabimicrobium amorphum TaxID=2596890 RepID=A0A5S9IHW7_UABAM|nr:hypothetical protein [Candidatus Uabimicrobium amorphum]BBM82129.1 hypothetical protein UABAM_00472 [Candidatus Uabimicrobium amorphum]